MTSDTTKSETLEGELIPPPQAVRRHYSTAEETVLAERVWAEHEAGERAAKEAVKHYRRCGYLLAEAKAVIGHGAFGPFLAKVGIKPRTAQIYMRLAREFPKLPPAKANRVAQLSLRDAIGELARTSGRIAKLPTPAMDRALADARLEPIKVTVNRAVTNEMVRAAQVRPAAQEGHALSSLDDEDDEDTGVATPEQVAAMQAHLDEIIGQRLTDRAAPTAPPARPDAQQELVLQVCSLLHRLREVSEKISGPDLYALFQGKFVSDLDLSLMPAAGLIGELLQAHSRARGR